MLAALPGEGYDTNYAVQRIADHWLAAALSALARVLWLTLARRPRDDEVRKLRPAPPRQLPWSPGLPGSRPLPRQLIEHRGAIVGHGGHRDVRIGDRLLARRLGEGLACAPTGHGCARVVIEQEKGQQGAGARRHRAPGLRQVTVDRGAVEVREDLDVATTSVAQPSSTGKR